MYKLRVTSYESQATSYKLQAGMGLAAEASAVGGPAAAERGESMRLDLDDVNGEILLLHWQA